MKANVSHMFFLFGPQRYNNPPSRYAGRPWNPAFLWTNLVKMRAHPRKPPFLWMGPSKVARCPWERPFSWTAQFKKAVCPRNCTFLWTGLDPAGPCERADHNPMLPAEWPRGPAEQSTRYGPRVVMSVNRICAIRFSQILAVCNLGGSLYECMKLRFDLRPKRKCPKWAKEFFNTFRNYVKTRDLAFQNFGRKHVEFLQKVFAIQKFLLPLHPINWGRLCPTSWYSIS